MTELVRKAELATERLAAQLAARGSGGAAALSACSPGVSPAVGDLIHAVRSSAHVRVSAQGLAGAGSSCGAAPRCTGGVGVSVGRQVQHCRVWRSAVSVMYPASGVGTDSACIPYQCQGPRCCWRAKLPCGLCAVQIHAHVHMTQLHVKRMCCACNTV